MGLIWKTRSDECTWGVAGCPRWEGESEDEAESLLPTSAALGEGRSPAPSQIRDLEDLIWTAASSYQALFAIEDSGITTLKLPTTQEKGRAASRQQEGLQQAHRVRHVTAEKPFVVSH